MPSDVNPLRRDEKRLIYGRVSKPVKKGYFPGRVRREVHREETTTAPPRPGTGFSRFKRASRTKLAT